MKENNLKKEILRTNLFKKQKKKLHKNQINDLDKAVRTIALKPEIGSEKRGDLKGVWVYKFRMVKQEYLLAYEWDAKHIWLIAIDVHENFYRDLKRRLKK